MEDIQEWAQTVASYRAALKQAMPDVADDFIWELVVDWQRLMIERAKNAPDVINLSLNPGPESAHIISRYITQAFKTRL